MRIKEPVRGPIPRVGASKRSPALTRGELAICGALGLATLLLYFRTFHYDFVFYDDNTFVYENPVIGGGLTLSNLAWAFGAHFANWHPLTWISYLIDAQIFGVNPGPFHAVNILLHAASAVLLFLALLRMTGRPWRSGLVAAIFALHPLHVESVAWVAERKDVLSTFFEMIALLLYARYAERLTGRRYLLVLLAFALSLMSKPMLVTFPVILLLLDYWPLGRLHWPMRWPRDWRVVIEKAPLLALSLAVSAATFAAQKSYGTVASLESTSLTARIADAAVAYVVYIKQSFWPTRLAVLYPTVTPSGGLAVLCLLILLAITAAALVFARRRPYIFAGWFWFVVMLLPVIGLIQVGLQAHADRYMYVPLTGLSIVLVWTIADWLEPYHAMRPLAAGAGAAVIAAFAVATWIQVGYWKDSRTLFEHTLAVTDRNYIIQNNLGVVLARAGDDKDAMTHYIQAAIINPLYAEAQGNIGNTLVRTRQFELAKPTLEEALRLKPDFPMALLDLGVAEENLGEFGRAIDHLTAAVRLNRDDPVPHSNLCYSLQRVERVEEAIVECREALRLEPNYKDAQYNLKTALERRGESAR